MDVPDRTQEEAFWRLQRWRTAVDEAIDEARQRGMFDNLPGHGKPLDLRGNPLAGDQELAFHVLEQAGVAPPWLEHDKEVAAERAALDALLARAAKQRQTLALAAPDDPPPWDEVSAFPWRLPRPWPRRRRRGQAATPPPPAPVSPRAWAVARDRLLRRVLEQAAALDAAIVRRNAALPKDLAFLEMPRYPPARAARAFDEAWPMVPPSPGEGEVTGG